LEPASACEQPLDFVVASMKQSFKGAGVVAVKALTAYDIVYSCPVFGSASGTSVDAASAVFAVPFSSLDNALMSVLALVVDSQMSVKSEPDVFPESQ
jgi:hypothetical protein